VVRREVQCKRARGIGSAREGVLISEDTFYHWSGPEVELNDILPLAPAVKEEVARLRGIVERSLPPSARSNWP